MLILPQEAKDRIAREECPACGKHKSKWDRRKDWTCCSSKCTDIYWGTIVFSRSWPELRLKCFERDGHKCVKCGVQPTWKQMRDYEPTHDPELVVSESTGQYNGKTVTFVHHIDDSALIADHIHAIALGGEEWDIANLQTLCIDCNKIKTAEDAGKIAELRKMEKMQAKGQRFLNELPGEVDGTKLS